MLNSPHSHTILGLLSTIKLRFLIKVKVCFLFMLPESIRFPTVLPYARDEPCLATSKDVREILELHEP